MTHPSLHNINNKHKLFIIVFVVVWSIIKSESKLVVTTQAQHEICLITCILCKSTFITAIRYVTKPEKKRRREGNVRCVCYL